MGRNHARVLQSMDGVELVAAVDPDGDPHRAISGLPLMASINELIEADVHYAVVAVPTAFHLEIGLALAAAGIHCLIEKPVADTAERAEQLVDAFAAEGLIGAVGHIERYNPALQHARARLAAGELGDVYQIVTRRQGPFPGRIADVGVVKDLGTHDIDLTAWVAQSPYLSVSAHIANRSGREHEDLVAFVGELDSGIVTNHLVNWLSPLKERITVITGERGTLVADTLTADLTLYENGTVASEWSALASFRGVSEGNRIRFAIPKPEPLRTEHEAFRDALLGLESDIVTLEQGLQTVRVAEAVLESAQTGKNVTVS